MAEPNYKTRIAAYGRVERERDEARAQLQQLRESEEAFVNAALGVEVWARNLLVELRRERTPLDDPARLREATASFDIALTELSAVNHPKAPTSPGITREQLERDTYHGRPPLGPSNPKAPTDG